MACFIDSNVFIHAFLQPKRKLQPHEHELKENAKQIVKRLRSDEKAITSSSHITEIANILESRMTKQASAQILRSIVLLLNLEVLSVDQNHLKTASIVAPDMNLGFNDTIAYILMQENRITEIYSFDKDFDHVAEITRITT